MARYVFTLATRRSDGEPVYWNFADTDDLFLSRAVDEALRRAGIDKQDWIERKVDLSLTTEFREEGEPFN